MRAICIVFVAVWLSLLGLAGSQPGLVQAEHTRATQKPSPGGEPYIRGLPTWCCDVRDCEETPVRLLRVDGAYAWVEAEGRTWKVIGRFGDGNGLFVAPASTYICPLSRRAGTARCALVRPSGGI